MYHFITTNLVNVIVFYFASWVCYVTVSACLFTALDKWFPRFLQRKRTKLEFWGAALAGFMAVSLPLCWIWVFSGFIHLLLGIVITLISIYMAHRRLREKAIDREHALGDYLGYLSGLALWVGLFLLNPVSG